MNHDLERRAAIFANRMSEYLNTLPDFKRVEVEVMAELKRLPSTSEEELETAALTAYWNVIERERKG